MLLSVVGVGLLAGRAGAGEPLPREVARIALTGVVGRIDHLALDALQGRLFVAALENGSIEVVDLGRSRVARLEGFREPQGVVFPGTVRKLFVTEGGASRVTVLDGDDLTRTGTVSLREDPDNVRYEPGANRVWVGEGEDESAALAAFGAEGGDIVAEVTLDGHPESFQLEARDARVFVNVPREHEVEVVDRERREVVARWKLPHSANFPMALDEEHRRLFIGCRHPAKVLVLDTATGKVVTELDSPGDADDLFLDPARDRLYVCAGEGLVRVYSRRGPDRFEALGDLRTGPGARTCLFDAESHRLYVAVPRRGAAAAEIVAFDTLPESLGGLDAKGQR